MKKKFYITTAIAYPNSAPHLGHALEIIQADVAARFHRLLGKDVFFQTGTDEHGVKNWKTAQKQGKDILEFLDANVAAFKDLYKRLSASYDFFIRTTDKNIHQPGVIKLWKELAKNGDIYKKDYKGMYCSGCESFKTEKDLEDGKCSNHPTLEIELVHEENYFFKLSKYKDEITKKIESDEYKIVPNARKNEILSFLKNVKDISFSRPKASLPWGIPVPGDDNQIMYVWCDALSNYITGAGYGRDEKTFKEIWPADVHIIGKDILRFHAAFWPAMLISARIKLPKLLFVHGFILSKGAKMGKSTGNVIWPFEQIERYGVDQFRFYIAGSMPIDGDGEYSEELLLEKVNAELVGNLSNFCYRVLSFTNKNFNSEIKEIDNDLVIENITKKFDQIKKAYEEFDFKKAIDEVMAVSAIGNKYFQDNEPWKLIKQDKEKAHKIVGLCVNLVKDLGILMGPVMPGFSDNLFNQLKLKNLKWKDLDFKLKNHKIADARILINKITEKIKEEFPLDLRIAKILSVEQHPGADRLYILKIDLGTEKRQLVAGVRKNYTEKELQGKNIIVVCNLKPAKLRGIISEGMLLAADNGKEIGLLTVEGLPGDSLNFGSMENAKKRIDIDNFSKIKLVAKEGKVYYKESILKSKKGDVSVERVNEGTIS